MKVALEHFPLPAELDAFLGSFPRATFFQTPAWLDALRESFTGFGAAWLVARDGAAIAGAMPVVRIRKGPFSRFWALPFGTYGDPLARDETAREALLDGFFALARSPLCLDGGVVLFRGDSPARIPRGARVSMAECRLVSIDRGFDEVWKKWSSKRRQLVRRGEEAGVAVRSLETEEEVRDFHRIYIEESRSWGGVHPYPERLFLELFRRRAQGAVLLGAFLNGALLGGHIDFYFGEMAQAWQGGMTKRAGEFEAGAILIRSAIEEACRRGCRLFNLGSSGGNRGILFFKESLGAREYRYPVITFGQRWWALVRGRGGE
ncbi:MAG: GNAT family N-acetyltransferase [Candidatus Krumholzibacteria bacterium]|nr:GNAT family N-acetyltransferase [Candidatus Krumholzibacteria bacterium]